MGAVALRHMLERVLLVAVAAGLSVAWLLTYDASPSGEADFNVFYQAALHWREPYAPESTVGLPAWMQNGRSPFAYPPTFLLLALPFTLLPYFTAYVVWAVGSFALFVLAASFLNLRAAWLLALSPFALLLAIGFGAPVTYQPLLYGLMTGQTAFWTGAGLIGAGLLLEKRPAWAGALLAIVACLKPTAALVAPLILWGRWRGLTAAVLTGLGLVLASLALGPHLWLEWIAAARAFKGGVLQLQPAAVFDHVLWQVALVALGGWFAWRERNLAGLLVGGVLCAPYLMPYDLAALTALGVSRIGRQPQHWALAAFGAALVVGLVGNAVSVLIGCVAVVLWFGLTELRRTGDGQGRAVGDRA
ncbi:MAG TPA: glycosyltransferase family 87 protein [Phenylobacterium sp.]